MVRRQPRQPVYVDEHGTYRFRRNALVVYLLDHGGIDMNALALLDFTDDDREQFAQLIGYSVSGFGELHYATDVRYRQAWAEGDRLSRSTRASAETEKA